MPRRPPTDRPSAPAARPPRSWPAPTGLLLLALAAAAGCGPARSPEAASPPRARAAPELDPGAPLEPDARRWVERTLASMSVREKAGQLVFPWMTGGYLSTAEARFDSLAALVERGIGGLSISVGMPLEYAARLNALQGRPDVPLLVVSDFESGGPGMRISGAYALPYVISLGGGTDFPPTMAFGAIEDERLTYELGRVTGREARAVGVHMTFAPVADVNSDPSNPVINTRSFGEDPQEVADRVAAFVRGASQAGVLTVAKHFPGHGDTEVDSHVRLPVLDVDPARLDTVEMVPFRRAVDAGVYGVMTAHLSLPKILESDSVPATFSRRVNREMLRERMGFRGPVITDALTMGAIVNRYGTRESAVRALEAGADLLLYPPEPVEAMDAVADAVRSGRITEARLDESVRRMLEAKARVGLHRSRTVDLDRVLSTVGRESHRALADTAAARSITLPRDRRGLVPLDTARHERVLSVTLARPEDLPAGRTFDSLLSGAVGGLRSVRVEPGTSRERYRELETRAAASDLVLLSAYVPPRSGAGSIAAPGAFLDFARGLLAGRGVPVVLLSFGNPYLLTSLPQAGTYLIAWGPGPRMQRAAARALLGRAPVTGRLPVSLPPLHRRGEGLSRRPPPPPYPQPAPAGSLGLDPAALARADSAVRAAIADSVTPGAALAVGRSGGLARLRGYGRLDWAPGSAAVTDSSLYDLASLTKVLATTTAVARLVEEERVDLDAPVSRYLPWFSGGGKSRVTVRQLLLHRSGLPAWRPWWKELGGKEAYRNALGRVELARAPGDSTVYSDLGFMTLGLLIEEVSGETLDRHVERTVLGPLGLGDTGFRPDSSLRGRIAATELDTVFRDGKVRGVVHDRNAYVMGGVSGHAGLFSSARDLARYARLLLNEGFLFGIRSASAVRVLEGRTLRRFTSPADSGAGRGLGWDVPDPESRRARPAGTPPATPDREWISYGSDEAYGHTGFTGTSIWVDPRLDVFVVLLTNRVNPSRDEKGHLALRRAVHRAVARAVRRGESSPRPDPAAARSGTPRPGSPARRDREPGPRRP